MMLVLYTTFFFFLFFFKGGELTHITNFNKAMPGMRLSEHGTTKQKGTVFMNRVARTRLCI